MAETVAELLANLRHDDGYSPRTDVRLRAKAADIIEMLQRQTAQLEATIAAYEDDIVGGNEE